MKTTEITLSILIVLWLWIRGLILNPQWGVTQKIFNLVGVENSIWSELDWEALDVEDVSENNMFFYQSLWLSMEIPMWRSVIEDRVKNCDDCDWYNVLKIITDIKDDLWYSAYVYLQIDNVGENLNEESIMEGGDVDILEDKEDRKIFWVTWKSDWYWQIYMKLKWVYYSININDISSEQPIPEWWDDMWQPFLPDDDFMWKVVDVIKSIN